MNETMTEAFERIKYTMEKKNILQATLAEAVGVEASHISIILSKQSCSLELFLKVLQELKLQLKLDGKRVKTIQDVAAVINKTTSSIYRFSIAGLSRRTGVTRRPISTLMDGKNVQIYTFFRVIDGLNIEVRII